MRFTFKNMYKNKYELAYRGLNAIAAGTAIYKVYNNPGSSIAEYLPDILLHSFESVNSNWLPSKLTKWGSYYFPEFPTAECLFGLNLCRSVQANFAYVSGKAAIPSIGLTDVQLGMLGYIPKLNVSFVRSAYTNLHNGVDVLNHLMNAVKRITEIMGADPREDMSKTLVDKKHKTLQFSQKEKVKTRTIVSANQTNYRIKGKSRVYTII